MDVPSLFSGPAPAGSPAPGAAIVAAAGSAAGPAGAAPRPDGEFASLVALALGQLGAPQVADGQAEPIAGRAAPRADDAAVEVAPADRDAPGDAADAATLAVLVALATPQPVALPAPVDLPIVTGHGLGAPGPTVGAPGPTVGASGSLPSPGLAPVHLGAPAAPVAQEPGVTVAPSSFATALAAAERTVRLDDAAADAGAPEAGAAAPPHGATPAPPAAASISLPPAPTPDGGDGASGARAAGEPAAAVALPAPDAPTASVVPAAEGLTRAEQPAPAGATTRPAAAARRELRDPAAAQIRDVLAIAREAGAAVPEDVVAHPQTATLVQAAAVTAASAHVSAAAAQDAPPGTGRSSVAAADAASVATTPASLASRLDGHASEPHGSSADGQGTAFAPTPAGASAGRPAPAGDSRVEPAAAPNSPPPPAVPAWLPSAPAGVEAVLRSIELPASARLEQALATLDPETRNLQAIVRTVRLFTAGDGLSEARLQLEPEHLGPVDLTVRVEQGSVSAHFRAETPAAQRWIETHQQELRAGLRDQGLEVKDVVVTTDPDGRRDRRQDTTPARPARPRRGTATEAEAPRFEVLV